jgi:hypothetical protein
VGDERQKFLASLIFGTRDRNIFRNLSPLILEIKIEIYLEIVASLILEIAPCSFGLISRISSHPAVFFSHNKPANSAFSTINQRNEQVVCLFNTRD